MRSVSIVNVLFIAESALSRMVKSPSPYGLIIRFDDNVGVTLIRSAIVNIRKGMTNVNRFMSSCRKNKLLSYCHDFIISIGGALLKFNLTKRYELLIALDYNNPL